MRELPTYTAVFSLRRRLYAIYDWELPAPVGLGEAGVFVLGVLLFAGLARLVGLELSPRSAWFFLVPPAFLAHAARRPLADAKPPLAWLGAQLRFLLEPRLLEGLVERHPWRRERASAGEDGA